MNATMGTTTSRVIRVPLRAERLIRKQRRRGPEVTLGYVAHPTRCQGIPVSRRVNPTPLAQSSTPPGPTQRGPDSGIPPMWTRWLQPRSGDGGPDGDSFTHRRSSALLVSPCPRRAPGEAPRKGTVLLERRMRTAALKRWVAGRPPSRVVMDERPTESDLLTQQRAGVPISLPAITLAHLRSIGRERRHRGLAEGMRSLGVGTSTVRRCVVPKRWRINVAPAGRRSEAGAGHLRFSVRLS